MWRYSSHNQSKFPSAGAGGVGGGDNIQELKELEEMDPAWLHAHTTRKDMGCYAQPFFLEALKIAEDVGGIDFNDSINVPPPSTLDPGVLHEGLPLSVSRRTLWIKQDGRIKPYLPMRVLKP